MPQEIILWKVMGNPFSYVMTKVVQPATVYMYFVDWKLLHFDMIIFLMINLQLELS